MEDEPDGEALLLLGPGERGVEHRQFDVLAPGPAFSSKEGRRDRLGDRVGGGLVGDQGADKVGKGK